MSNKFIYFFIRRDLSSKQQIIQTAHATQMMAIRAYKETGYEGIPNAVLMGALDEPDLLDIKRYLDDNDIKSEMFFEPDISSYTAIATFPLEGDERIPLRSFKTL